MKSRLIFFVTSDPAKPQKRHFTFCEYVLKFHVKKRLKELTHEIVQHGHVDEIHQSGAVVVGRRFLHLVTVGGVCFPPDGAMERKKMNPKLCYLKVLSDLCMLSNYFQVSSFLLKF